MEKFNPAYLLSVDNQLSWRAIALGLEKQMRSLLF